MTCEKMNCPRCALKATAGFSSLKTLSSTCPHPIVFKKLQDEGDGAAVDAYEQVDAGQGNIRSAWDAEYVGHGVHHGRHRPPVRKRNFLTAILT